MGYTHYFNKERPFTDNEWSILIKSFRKLYNQLDKVRFEKVFSADYCRLISETGEQGQPVLIQPEYELGWTDFTTNPHVSPDGEQALAFNGVGDMAHETFLLERCPNELGFDFCKTNGKPYDLMVTSMLIVCAGACEGALTIRSDGEAEDWEQAACFVSKVLSKPTKVEFIQVPNDEYSERIQVRSPTPEELEQIEAESLFYNEFAEPKKKSKANHLKIVESNDV